MKIFFSVLMCSALFYVTQVRAINVGAITSMMAPDQNILAKEVINTVDDARLVSLGVERISSPMEGGTVIPMVSKLELMVTPSNLILPGKGKDVFRVFYAGPKDDKERYYRLVWRDNPVVEEGLSKTRKAATATTSATISTILVVAPRQNNFNYQYRDGVVYNSGNSSFRVVAFGPCKQLQKNQDGSKGCRERYYVMPGLGVHLKFVDVNNKKLNVGIWHNEDYITVK
ncbi:EcpB family pilus assembly chaperone [Serratia aquatilis]|uniref:Probable fimbrial chaperone EcpB n=1 Tax=Serratia aquatilis TaxID=1737515 RepID=A0ABV6ECN0_9GAMM